LKLITGISWLILLDNIIHNQLKIKLKSKFKLNFENEKYSDRRYSSARYGYHIMK